MKYSSTRRISVATTLAVALLTSVIPPAQAATSNVVKASSAIAASLNRMASSSTTPADFAAMAVGTGSAYPGITVTVLPLYGDYQLFNVRGADGERCVTPITAENTSKQRFASRNIGCEAYAKMMGPEIDKGLVIIHKGITQVALVAYTIAEEGLFGKKRINAAWLQKFGSKRPTKTYLVTNIPTGIRISLADRPSAAFTVTVNSAGKVKI